MRQLMAMMLACWFAACAGVREAPTPRPAAAMPALAPPSADAAQAGMVDVRSLAPDLQVEMRYAGADNFTGTRVDGYDAPRCYLHHAVAEALARVQAGLRAQHRSLRIYDCYRPARAVARFMRWARDTGDLRTKADYYPGLDKPALVPDYIAAKSGHSRGATVDLTLVQCDAAGRTCTLLDMGTRFDLFDPRANTDDARATPLQRGNRHALRDAMQAQGFANYPMEWWHYTYRPEPTPATYFDFPVR